MIPVPLAAASDGAAIAPSDADVVARVLAGCPGDFEIVVRRHERAVFSLALRTTRDRDAAEDVAQETFARAWTRLRDFDARRPMRPWLLRIAANLAVSHVRAAGRTVAIGEREPVASRNPRGDAALDELRERLRDACEELSPEMRAVVALRYDEELSIEEIARAVDRRPGAVKVALHRARLRLREIVFGHREPTP